MRWFALPLALYLSLAAAPAVARPRRPARPVVVQHEAPAAVHAAATAAAKAAPLSVGRRSTRDLLLAIADHESSFRPSVMRCTETGDGGKAHGAYQLHPETFWDHTADEVCASDVLQARLALTAIRAYLTMFPHLGVEGAVRGYASGHPRKDTAAAREILELWRKRRGHR